MRPTLARCYHFSHKSYRLDCELGRVNKFARNILRITKLIVFESGCHGRIGYILATTILFPHK